MMVMRMHYPVSCRVYGPRPPAAGKKAKSNAAAPCNISAKDLVPQHILSKGLLPAQEGNTPFLCHFSHASGTPVRHTERDTHTHTHTHTHTERERGRERETETERDVLPCLPS